MPSDPSPDAYEIRDVAALRSIIGEAMPGIADKNQPALNRHARAFISRCPFLILSTSSESGQMDASPKGDAPGFVHIVNDTQIIIPDRPGNKLAYGHLNVIENPRVGILMMIPGTRETLRINGRAALTANPDLLEALAARGKPATLAIKIHIEEVFFHCAKAFIRSRLWDHQSWGAPHKVSFGEMFAEMRGEDRETAEKIDQMIETGYEQNL